MKKYFLLICFLAIAHSMQAQLLKSDRAMIGYKLNAFLRKTVSVDTAFISKTCSRGCTFAKFTINNQNEVSKLSFSKGSESFLVKSMSMAIKALKSNPRLIKLLKSTRKTILLPIIYDYSLGCRIEPMDQTKATNEDRYKNLLAYFKMRMESDHFPNLYNMLNFEGGSEEALDGLLIKPFVIGAVKDPGY